GAWGRDQKVNGRIRMMADGSGLWTRALGLELDLVDRGLGVRSQRYSMVVDNGLVTLLNLENGGGYSVSDAATLVKQL
ncbi:MAG: redoxin family protein, partial [Pusillimonas sp.]